MPPRERVVRTWKRVTGTGVTSRSCTWTPDPFTPAISARLIVRDARDASRLITTAAPRFSVVAYAMPRRTAKSGVMSTLISPLTPRLPNSVRAPEDSQMMLCVMTAPASTRL